MGLLSGLPLWAQFTILYVPFIFFIWNFSPSLKWKILFSIAGIIGIAIALAGRSIKLHN